MELGAFSVSLSVIDIHASKAFYEKLGFEKFAGDISQNWLIMKNDDKKCKNCRRRSNGLANCLADCLKGLY